VPLPGPLKGEGDFSHVEKMWGAIRKLFNFDLLEDKKNHIFSLPLQSHQPCQGFDMPTVQVSKSIIVCLQD